MSNNLNESQQKAASTTEGPVLIIAGPGTGKTHTLVMRIVNLIKSNKALPENLLIATFTEKAAKEIITRITNELLKQNISVNLNDMHIGTFHSICLKIIKENVEFTRLKKNFTTLDSFDQTYRVFQNLKLFKAVENFEAVFTNGSAWTLSKSICKYMNLLTDESAKIEDIITDDMELAVLKEVYARYTAFLTENNLVDFSSLQTIAYKLLSENGAILGKLLDKIKYIMIDEYQDTNHIQEKLIFLINDHNVCVVGDDDQGLYRFRGATIRNILEFPNKFPHASPAIIKLDINYRSTAQIVNFYNEWMSTLSHGEDTFDWGKFRYPKDLKANNTKQYNSPTVLQLSGKEINEWHDNIVKFINDALSSGKITDLNQIAFLFKSVSNDKVKSLADHLEANNISVYAPRSDMFFSRPEIRLLLGCLILMFPKYVHNLESKSFEFNFEELFNYYEDCASYAGEVISQPKYAALQKWLVSMSKHHAALQKNTDYAFSGLLYELFQFSPFKEYLDTDCKGKVASLRDVRNISILVKMIVKYEYLHKITVLTPEKIDSHVEKLFNLFLRMLTAEGMNEYEDESEYAPSGCVSFLTIHQSKGMEFPIVFVGSLSGSPKMDSDKICHFLRKKFLNAKPLNRKI